MMFDLGKDVSEKVRVVLSCQLEHSLFNEGFNKCPFEGVTKDIKLYWPLQAVTVSLWNLINGSYSNAED